MESLPKLAGGIILEIGRMESLRPLSFDQTSQAGLSRAANLPIIPILFNPSSIFGNIVDTGVDCISRGRNFVSEKKWDDFEKCGWNVFAMVSPLPQPNLTVGIADAEVAQELFRRRAEFLKPLESTTFLGKFGENILVTGGDEWKRHKRISAPAFSERTNRLVWICATTAMSSLHQDVWGGEAEVVAPDIATITTQIALTVLSKAGFGKEMSWKSFTNPDIPSGHEMSFPQALKVVTSNLIYSFALPSWAMGITTHLKTVKTAYEELRNYTDEFIDNRMEAFDSKLEAPSDLLSNLVAASEDEGKEEGGVRLTRSEIRGNVFVYLVAGFESTGHTMAFCIGLLALYPKEQEKLYEHIKSVIGERQAEFADYPKLTRLTAVLNEALRMFPASTVTLKRSQEDTAVSVSAAEPKSDAKTNVLLPRNTWIAIFFNGIHYNPRYWPDPYTFKPDRFLRSYNKDAFLPFSGGERPCIGRRFAEVELAAAILEIVTNYTIHPTEQFEKEFGNLPMRAKTEKLLNAQTALTPKPNMSLLFKKRV